MRICPTCSTTFPTQVGFCPKDGSPLVELQEWTPGATIRGKYRILSSIGQGGMGSVYKALHLGFHELRALKVLSQELAADARFVKRFKQEAFATRRLQHLNVVRVEDIDETEEGRPFIVMEFIEGMSLRQLIEKHGAMRMAAACSIVRQIASALAVAHRLGVVHRDLKPDNIFLVAPPKGPGASTEPMVKVLDFGIAKLNEVRSEGHPGDSTLTQPGMILGTPRYMSPEQARGKRGDDLDGRSDIYSLGILMYQMLTGQLPFQGTTTMEMLLAHLQEEPTPIRSIRPELQIPAPIADIVMQCLEKSREARPQTAEALIQALERAETICMEAAFTQKRDPQHPEGEDEPIQQEVQETVLLQEHPAALVGKREAAPAKQEEAALAPEQDAPAREAVQAEEAKTVSVREREPAKQEAAFAAAHRPGGMHASMIVPGANPNIDHVLPATPAPARQEQTPVLESSPGKTGLPSVPKKDDGQPSRGKRWVMAVAGISVLIVIGFLISNRGRKLPDTAVPNIPQELSTPAATPSPTSVQDTKKTATPSSQTSEAAKTPMRTTPQKTERPSGSAAPQISPTVPDHQARMLEAQKQVRAAETEGDIFRERGEYDEAIRAYQVGLKVDPANAALLEKITKSRRAKAVEQELNH